MKVIISESQFNFLNESEVYKNIEDEVTDFYKSFSFV